MTVPTDAIASQAAVRKTVTVEAPQAHCFEVFTGSMSAWWPLLTHHIGKAPAAAAIVEPKAGGRWFERGNDGSECDWGTVLIWEPPDRVVLAWELNSDWQHDRTIQSEVEVRFVAIGPETTRVELEHRKLDVYGERAATMAQALAGEGGWSGILDRFALQASGKPLPPEVDCQAG